MPAIGQDQLSSLVRHHVIPIITDNIYGQIPVFFRLMMGNKRTVNGGRWIEAPLMYKKANVGGSYTGAQVLTMAQFEDVKNGFWNWKQYYVPVVIDGLTLIMADSPLAIADYIKKQMKSAEMYMADLLSNALWATAPGANDIDSITTAVDSTGTYAGLNRAVDTWWAANETTGASTVSHTFLNNLFMNASVGGRHPTLICSRKDQYNRYFAVNMAAGERPHFISPTSRDEVLANAGFVNQIFNGVPWVVDDTISRSNSTDSDIFMLNEEFFEVVVSPRGDFIFKDFTEPHDQDAITGRLHFVGNVIQTSSRNHSKASNVTA